MPAITLEHPRLGHIRIVPNTRSRKVSARWKNGTASFTVPAGISTRELLTAINSLADRLLSLKPAIAYHEGQRIACPGVEYIITRQSLNPDTIIARPALPATYIQIGTAIDIDSQDSLTRISRILCRLAAMHAPDILLPRAKSLAEKLGAIPKNWKIGRGHKVLGSCSSRGVITLSYILVFMPQELRDYIVCHELAHLSHMNHSEEFHRVCNSYCNGNESRLHAAMKAFRFPVLRQ